MGYGTRTQFFATTSQSSLAALAPPASDGICKTIVEPFGYTCEEHTVTTKDGFILGMQRIPAGKSGGNPGKGPPDGAIWAILSPEESLAFILADNGYDVWLANARGTRSSLGHTSLKPSDQAFWDWSWDELAAYDIPATCQYVHDQTGQNLHYVVVINGTLAMYDYGNEDENKKHYGTPTPPEYNIANIPEDVALFIGNGGADALSDVKDVQALLDILKDHPKDKLVVQTIQNYAHADFVLAVNANKHHRTVWWQTTYHMEMTNSLALIIVCALFCGSAAGARLKLFSDHNATATLHPTAADGICKIMVETRGYACEEHKVTTKDGYILSLQRIPVGRSVAKWARIRPPVILQHGVLMAYWDWTWDQLVAYDLPATFEYVQALSKNQLSKSVRSVGLLCPIAHLGQLTSPLAKAAADNFVAETMYQWGLGQFEPLGTGKIMMYNYTSEALNMEHYGQPTPPVYDMSKIPNHIPLFISYGGADELADFRDVQLLLRNLRRRHGDRHVVQYRPNYAHADFVMSDNAKRDVYDPLMIFLKLQ
ncbi:hypothetical protein Tsubulata_031791 [Turnera subulata]|uniref:Partial AB-hydrolase lipase domain-containing protein n=1 Tax=Turnera subulata TaxID=218843 RepID=A0A9Q0J6Q7_9ROSI|nr:hypothetical protein Tsubulata_031791 [Turnera subulata]